MIQSVDRAFRLLELLAEHPPSLPLGELARLGELPSPTAYRILQTLVELGYAERLDEGRYAYGARLLSVAGRALSSDGIASRAGGALRGLAEHTLETIHFGLLAGDHAQYVDKVESRRAYRLDSVIGMLVPLHCTAIGKAILAHLDEDRLAPLLAPDRLESHTPHTITTPAALRRELDEVRERGYAIDDEEDRLGVRCVGAPVFDHLGHVVGGVSVSAPVFHFPIEDAHALAPRVMRTAGSMSAALGAPGSAVPAPHRQPAP